MGRNFKNYTPEEVDNFLEQIIKQVEIMIEDNRSKNAEIALKDKKIKELESKINEYAHIEDKLAHYEKMESTLNRAVLMAQKTSDQIKSTAHKESELILEDAKKNASRIVNESLLKAEKIEEDAESLKRNIILFKKRLRGIIQNQLDMVDDIEDVKFKSI